MPTANYDASRVTQRLRAVALYTFSANNQAAVNAGQSVRREQPESQLGETLMHRNIAKAFNTPVNPSTGLPETCATCAAEDIAFPSGANGTR